MNTIDVGTLEALKRLLTIAEGNTHQSRRVADFLLAWWNAGSCGAFDLTSMWALDAAIVADMAVVFRYIGHSAHYPCQLGLGGRFESIVRNWRPELVK